MGASFAMLKMIVMGRLGKAAIWTGYHPLLFYTESASRFFSTRNVTVFYIF